MNVLLPAPCAQIHAPLVLENPSTGMKCIVDAKIDTGSFATVISSTTMHRLGIEPFTEDWVELANGEPALSRVCMCRVHLSEDDEMLDLPIYVIPFFSGSFLIAQSENKSANSLAVSFLYCIFASKE